MTEDCIWNGSTRTILSVLLGSKLRWFYQTCDRSCSRYLSILVWKICSLFLGRTCSALKSVYNFKTASFRMPTRSKDSNHSITTGLRFVSLWAHRTSCRPVMVMWAFAFVDVTSRQKSQPKFLRNLWRTPKSAALRCCPAFGFDLSTQSSTSVFFSCSSISSRVNGTLRQAQVTRILLSVLIELPRKISALGNWTSWLRAILSKWSVHSCTLSLLATIFVTTWSGRGSLKCLSRQYKLPRLQRLPCRNSLQTNGESLALWTLLVYSCTLWQTPHMMLCLDGGGSNRKGVEHRIQESLSPLTLSRVSAGRPIIKR